MTMLVDKTNPDQTNELSSKGKKMKITLFALSLSRPTHMQ